MEIKFTFSTLWLVALTLVFALLRMVGVIDWSTTWVLSPLWLPPALFFGVIFLGIALFGVYAAVIWIALQVFTFISWVSRKKRI